MDANSPAQAPDGLTWCTAYQSLQAALQAAQAGDEVRVADGVYKPVSPPSTNRIAVFLLKSDVGVYGGYAGCGAPNPDLRDYALFESILSGDLNGDDGPGFLNNAENSHHVVAGYGVNAAAVLDGFTITGGNANGANPSDRGGGIFNYFVAGSPTYRNLIVRGNYATQRGGGVYNDQTAATYANCLITGNGSGMWGGGMYNSGVSGGGTRPVVMNCTIAGNFAAVTGGMYNSGPAQPSILSTILWLNTHSEMSLEGAQITPGQGGVRINFSFVQGLTNSFFHGIANSSADPHFVDPDGSDNQPGNADDDFRLAQGSPCINAGDPALVPVVGTRDLEYLPRIQGCRVDAGAVERQVLIDPGDIDADGALTLKDQAYFALCFAAPSGNPPWAETCLCAFDANGNNTIDLADHAALFDPAP